MGTDECSKRVPDTSPVDTSDADSRLARRMFMKKSWLVGPAILAAFTVNKTAHAQTCIPISCQPGGGCEPDAICAPTFCSPNDFCWPLMGCWPDWQRN